MLINVPSRITVMFRASAHFASISAIAAINAVEIKRIPLFGSAV
jgi:hypothetical protein